GIDRTDGQAVAALLPELAVRLDYGPDGVQRMYLNGEDVSAAIRQPEISMYASAVSAIPAVRAFLLDMQRDMAKTGSVVMDGRDIGTVVLPDAGLKIFLTASAEARAKRRLAELLEKGEDCTLQQVMDDMLQRDAQDARRAAAPLRAAEDAVLADTTDFTLEESIEYVCGLIRERFGLEAR
ncbi:MAG: (d)CMP kinase, partial [Oscillospiraceae bacterium]|nr:(d)CMP kinase [Oscillospiraceae bacterium]